jgi:alkanesulfonate monooxygenase SsuD/methylene tetrahydromethanopterin reductase-like flavin-dependent oxidoreductase (luciferase family)
MTLRVFVEPQLGASYEQLAAAARAAEEAGYGAFFRSDHIGRMGPRTGAPTITDAWTTLAGLARDTSTIRLGTLVSPVTFRHIGMFAVTATQVDQMSNGRLEIGLGAGWYAREHERFGLPFPALPERQDALSDQLALLAGLWSAPSGPRFEYVGATGTWSIAPDELRPRQQPRPPIVLGGQGKSRSAALAVRYADEYNAPFRAAETTQEIHDRVRRACEAEGRDPGSLVYSAAQVICCGITQEEIASRAAATGRDLSELRENGFAGTPQEILDKIGTFADHGVERLYLQFLDLTDLDHLQLVAESVQPHAPGR